MVKKIFLTLSIVFIIWMGRGFFDEYLYMHKYYDQMLHNWTSIRIALIGCVFAMIPTAYLVFVKKKTWRGCISSIFLGLLLFSFMYISIRTDIYGGSISLFLHIVILFVLAIYTLVAFEVVGTWIYSRMMGRDPENIFDVCINLGLGLAVFLLLVYILVLLNIFYPLVSWAMFLGAGVLMWLKRVSLRKIRDIIAQTLSEFTIDFHRVRYLIVALPLLGLGIAGIMHEMTMFIYVSLFIGCALCLSYIWYASQHNDWGMDRLFSFSGLLHVLAIMLVMLSCWYLFQGFQLAYLPYPTAWDANHAYMFYPKMRALHGGYYWSEPNMSTSMHLRPMFIAYFFSLFTPFTSFLGISPDTIAIEMNFWSGILVLIFGLGLIAEVVHFLQGTQTSEVSEEESSGVSKLIFLMGWFFLLLWLTSGMGAFLVFIDNKTDMGVFALIILALYSGFVFLNKIRDPHTDKSGEDTDIAYTKELGKYIALSGFLYGIAALAKPTALFDVANFGLFMWFLRFGWIGVLGAFLLMIGGMTGINFRGIKNYIPTDLSRFMILPGLLGVGVDAVRIILQRLWVYVRYLLVWVAVLLGTLAVVKLPFMLGKMSLSGTQYTPKTFIQSLLFSHTTETETATGTYRGPLLAQAGNANLSSSCSLQTQGLSDIDQLYDTTKKAPGDVYNEDVGRYVGFGWKGNAETDAGRQIIPLINPFRASWMQPGCYGFNPFSPSYAQDAKRMCEQEAGLNVLDINVLTSLVNTISPNSTHKDASVRDTLQEIIDGISSSTNPANNLTNFRPQLQQLQAFMQENSIKVVEEDDVQKVYFPYKYLAPENISFNRSLQNLSSYYTDIGVVRLMMLYFIVIGLVYGLCIRQRKLVGLSLVTLFGRGLWWLIGGSILWYAIGLIIWTILAFIMYLRYLLSGRKDVIEDALTIIFVIGLLLFAGFQMVLNMVRISSQGGGGAFLRYKTGYGPIETISDNLQPSSQITSSFGANDVFDMQFRHYKKYLDLANSSTTEEGSLIAGTYIRYFVNDQTNVVYDQFLTWLWEMFSDGDACNSYLRLQDNHIKYLVIDPNIGTVVQGAGNQSLFDRFFGRVDAGTNTLLEHGTMTMLVNLYQQGYLSYVSSNNLGAKYAFILPDSTFFGLTGDALILQRARMALARYFSSSPGTMDAILQVAEQRIQDGMFVADIADILGLDIRESTLVGLIQKGQLTPEDIVDLTQDERKAIGQYLSLRTAGANDPAALRTQLQQIIKQSVSSGNQIIVLEVNE